MWNNFVPCRVLVVKPNAIDTHYSYHRFRTVVHPSFDRLRKRENTYCYRIKRVVPFRFSRTILTWEEQLLSTVTRLFRQAKRLLRQTRSGRCLLTRGPWRTDCPSLLFHVNDRESK